VRHSDFVILTEDLSTKKHMPVELLYQEVSTPFGLMIIACELNGLRFCDFVNNTSDFVRSYEQAHPDIILCQGDCSLLQKAKKFLSDPLAFNGYLPVIVNATPFQLAMWKSVLTIPWGKTSTYASIAADAGYPDAVRAAGTAIGKNPVLFLIPCHRVVLSSGKCGDYLHGPLKKKELLNYEFVHEDCE
jgi:AraC family transcriptional regulator of adaptative response/methylated-DNA-[protein]-cysteine methyltransferase